MAFEVWNFWRQWGTLPTAGGWLEQPLDLLVQMDAIDMVYRTIRYSKQKEINGKVKKYTATQLEILRWTGTHD